LHATFATLELVSAAAVLTREFCFQAAGGGGSGPRLMVLFLPLTLPLFETLDKDPSSAASSSSSLLLLGLSPPLEEEEEDDEKSFS